jgi:hypothetical protein
MIKEFELKKAADGYNKTQISGTGIIDTNKLFSYRYNLDVFKKNLVVPNAKSHGIIMFIDFSGSMQGNKIDATIRQMLSLIFF